MHAIAFPRSESAQQHSSELTLAAVKLAEDSRSACSAISVSRRGAPSSIRSSEPSSIARNKFAELELRLKLERVRELELRLQREKEVEAQKALRLAHVTVQTGTKPRGAK